MALLDVPGLALLPESTIFLCLAIGRFNALTGLRCYAYGRCKNWRKDSFNALMGLSCYCRPEEMVTRIKVSMPSWAWIVTVCWRTYRNDCYCFNALMGLNCYCKNVQYLEFSWYFLCIPAIYRCILAYLPIFFNQLSKFLRCESPSTFLGTCLSHHSFIILLLTSTSTLLSGLYIISTMLRVEAEARKGVFQCLTLGLIHHFYGTTSKT